MDSEVVIIVASVISALSGVVVGGGSVFALLARANQSKELKDSTEQLLANLVPAQHVTQLNQLANRLLDVVERRALDAVTATVDSLEFVTSVTDGRPND